MAWRSASLGRTGRDKDSAGRVGLEKMGEKYDMARVGLTRGNGKARAIGAVANRIEKPYSKMWEEQIGNGKAEMAECTE
jgi:hypothetical protein